MKIIGVYKITNTITGDFYIGSSKNIERRWASHKWPSLWNEQPNNPMYMDMKKYGVNKFEFEILAEVESSSLKEVEQQFIETLKPTYNNRRANGLDIERWKKHQKKYHKSDKYKNIKKEYDKKYHKSDKYKDHQKEYKKKYQNQLCSYNGKTFTLNALSKRFYRAGIEHPTLEAKKYLIK